MNERFATKDVFLNRKVRAKFVKSVKRQIRKVRKAERAARGLPPLAKGKCGQKRRNHKKRPHHKRPRHTTPDAPAPTPAPTPAAPAPVSDSKPVEAPHAAAPAAAAAPAVQHPGHKKNIIFSKVNAPVAKDQTEITVKLTLNYHTVASNADDLMAFNKAFRSDVARALGIRKSRISVTAIQTGGSAGGMIVKFVITPRQKDAAISNPSDPKSVDALADKFAVQSQNSHSVLMSSAIIAKLDENAEIHIVKQQSASAHGAIGAHAAGLNSATPASASTKGGSKSVKTKSMKSSAPSTATASTITVAVVAVLASIALLF